MPGPYDQYIDSSPWDERIPNYGAMPQLPPPMIAPEGAPDLAPMGNADGPQFSPMQGYSAPQNQSSMALRQLIDQQANQEKPSLKRQIFGTIVGAYAPNLGQEIAHPGSGEFNRKYKLLSEQAKREDDDLNRARLYQEMTGTQLNQQLMRRAQTLAEQDRQTAALDKDRDHRDSLGEQTLYATPGQEWMSPMHLQSPEPGVVSGVPLGGATIPGVQTLNRPTVPEGYRQVTTPSYVKEPGAIQVVKTDAQKIRDNYIAKTEETPQFMKDAMPGVPDRMTPTVMQMFAAAMDRKDTARQAQLLAQTKAEEDLAYKKQHDAEVLEQHRFLAEQASADRRANSANAGTLQLQEDQDGKPVLFNSKTGEVKPAGNIQTRGTKAKADAAEEKLVGPARDALAYGQNYLAEKQFTGAGDEALMEKFFELAKPSTGFRMTEAQQDMLKKAQDLKSSAEGMYNHATKGTWFSDKLRKDTVKTMEDLARARMSTVTTPKGSTPAAASGYQVGHVYGGLEYLGGDIKNEASWKKAKP